MSCEGILIPLLLDNLVPRSLGDKYPFLRTVISEGETSSYAKTENSSKWSPSNTTFSCVSQQLGTLGKENNREFSCFVKGESVVDLSGQMSAGLSPIRKGCLPLYYIQDMNKPS